MERVSSIMQFAASSWQTQSWTITLCTAAFIWFAFLVNTALRNGRPRLPPSPPAWPVIGHLLSLGKLPHQGLANLSRTYGPIFRVRMGSVRCVVISSPDLAKEILKTQDHIFASRPRVLTSELGYGADADIVFTPLGDHLRKLRKICTTELFTTKRVGQFEYVRREEILNSVRSVLEEGAEGKLVQLPVRMTELSFNTMTRILFSKRYYGLQGNGSKGISSEATDFHELIRKKASYGYFVIGEYFPSLRKLDIGGKEEQMRRLQDRFDSFLTNIVEEHRERLVNATDDTRRTGDFTDVLLSLEGDTDGNGLTETQVKGMLLTMLLGGSETASNTVLWTLAELMRNPDIRHKVQMELDAVVGKNRLVSESDLVHLRYLKAVVKESYRLHTVVPLLVPRESLKATKVAGYDIPAGTRIFVNAYAIHRDPNVWENPLKFDPERFIDASVDVRGQNFAILPFGSGRRVCVGVNLGEIMVELMLAHLLHMCDFALPLGMNPLDVSLEEGSGLTSPMAKPLELKVSRRLPSHV